MSVMLPAVRVCRLGMVPGLTPLGPWQAKQLLAMLAALAGLTGFSSAAAGWAAGVGGVVVLHAVVVKPATSSSVSVGAENLIAYLLRAKNRE
jgi:hypothetical protein